MANQAVTVDEKPVKHPQGRKTAYKHNMLRRAKEYINGGYKELEHPLPTVIGLARALNVHRSTIYEWVKDKSHPFYDTFKHCNDAQHLELINKGLIGEFNSNITKLILGHNHGYSDHQEGGNKVEISVNRGSVEIESGSNKVKIGTNEPETKVINPK